MTNQEQFLKEQITYKRWARALNLPDLGSRFNNNKYEIVGMRVGGPYKSLIYKDLSNGKRYRISVKTAVQLYPDLPTVRGF